MASRVSAVREVLGLPAEDSLLLAQHDEEFFEEAEVAESSSSSSDDDLISDRSASGASDDSEQEENLDSVDLADRSTGSLADLLDDEPAPKRPRTEPTTLEEVSEKAQQGCKCSGKNCFLAVPTSALWNLRRMTEAINSEIRETFLAGQLLIVARRASVSHGGQAQAAGPEERHRVTYAYSVHGEKVCQAVFLYANSCTRHVLQKVQAHLEAGCVVTPTHGLSGKKPWNVHSDEENLSATLFIQNYADVHGLPQPAAPRGHNKPPPIYLPCHTTKKMVHGLFMSSGGTMSYVSFTRVWKTTCADIVIMQPREDVCGTCAQYQSQIARAITEDERLTITESLKTHITAAMDARDHYRACITRAKLAETDSIEQESDNVSYLHATFDFAQQATIPHHARQVGPLYFRVPRRVQIFGVANEGLPKQVNYLVDENETIGKDGSKSHGPNSVISMLHHYLENKAKKADILGLHADNCCGQNKNKSVIAYLAWRVMVGLNMRIELDFMRVGHTRCFVDAGFGLLKQKYRKADVDTITHLVEAVESSAGFNEAVTFCWEWRSWDAFFADKFKPVKNITAYQRFCFSSSKPGEVEMSCSDKYPDKTLNILRQQDPGFSTANLPPTLQPQGITPERALYLFKEIRQFCHSESRDITCPEPPSSTGGAAQP